MGLVSTLVERRALEKTFVENPAEWLVQMYGGRALHSGVAVTPTTSMQASAVHACVRASTDTMGSLPLKVFRYRPGGGKEPAPEHPLFTLLHDAPNREHTAMEFREMGQASLLLRGNFYAEIVRDGFGRITALWPIVTDWVTVERVGRVLEYVVEIPASRVSSPNQPLRLSRRVRYPADQILHVRGLSFDGVLGLAPIQYHAEAIGLSLATEAYGGAFFGGGSTPAGVIERPREAGAFNNRETVARLREQWQETYSGLRNAHRKPAVLEDGMTWKPLTIPNNHAQFLETRDYQVGDIARVFRMPGVMIGYNDKSATYASAEQFFQSYATHHVLPWATKWEQAIALKCMTPEERTEYYVRHVLNGLLRGNIRDRYDAYNVGRQGGWLSADDIREMEDMNPLPNGSGKIYWAPTNMVPADELSAFHKKPEPAPAAAAAEEEPEEPEDDEKEGEEGEPEDERSQALLDRYRRLLRQDAKRAVRREIETVRKEAPRLASDVVVWRAWVDQFYTRHAAYLSEVLHVSLEQARVYADDHRAALLSEGVSVLQSWEETAASSLVGLALESLPA